MRVVADGDDVREVAAVERGYMLRVLAGDVDAGLAHGFDGEGMHDAGFETGAARRRSSRRWRERPCRAKWMRRPASCAEYLCAGAAHLPVQAAEMLRKHWSTDAERIEAHRDFFANLIAARAGVSAESELATAFRTTPRERFVGGPPWRILTRHGFVEAPHDDPAFLYQDVVVSLGADGLNNGEPSLHAMCIATLRPQRGDSIVHVGAGTGYYTTILAKLVGERGVVDAYEIEPGLVRRAAENLAPLPQVRLHARSGAMGPLPPCDVLYVNAGATAPLGVWLDALKPGGRLLFPLTPDDGAGAMLLITRTDTDVYAARFLLQAQFVGCVGARDDGEEQRLEQAFRNRSWNKVKSLHRDDKPGAGCWLAGRGWWLSTENLSAEDVPSTRHGTIC